MKANVNIILGLILMTGACSSTSLVSKDYIGSDTIASEQVYPRYAFQEYGVMPSDTIWFDDFLVVGADTLEYQQGYNTGRRFRIMIRPGPGGLYWSTRLKWFNPDLYISDFEPLYGLEDSWSYTDPFISPHKPWVEIALDGSRDTKRPLYTYYMGLPPRAPVTDQSKGNRNGREHGLFINIPLVSAIIVLLSL
jgi:hypothetical protein